ncbi:hypothetical protein KUT72_24995, partial [Pseudomonas aeruginosa]|nr:hypothetical protein [Pseudomonas aeruginosa]
TAIFRSAHSPFGRAWPNVIPSTLCEARVITTAAQACQNSPPSLSRSNKSAQTQIKMKRQENQTVTEKIAASLAP